MCYYIIMFSVIFAFTWVIKCWSLFKSTWVVMLVSKQSVLSRHFLNNGSNVWLFVCNIYYQYYSLFVQNFGEAGGPASQSPEGPDSSVLRQHHHWVGAGRTDSKNQEDVWSGRDWTETAVTKQCPTDDVLTIANVLRDCCHKTMPYRWCLDHCKCP